MVLEVAPIVVLSDQHHRHAFTANGTEIEPPAHVGEDHWPTLGDVLHELHQLWLEQTGVKW